MAKTELKWRYTADVRQSNKVEVAIFSGGKHQKTLGFLDTSGGKARINQMVQQEYGEPRGIGPSSVGYLQEWKVQSIRDTIGPAFLP